jgi:cation:H+ antiporter
VTLVAVLFGGNGTGADLAVGAAMGGPLVVGTLAYGVTGAVLLWRHHRRSRIRRGDLDGTDVERLIGDQVAFLAIFVVKVVLGLVAFAIKPWLGLLFFVAYAAYFVRELRADGDPAEHVELAPLLLTPRAARPPGWAVWLQTLAAVGVIFAASRVFVTQLEWAGPALGLATVVALLLSPIATELPEVLNAVIWVRQGKTRLALANISGAMMIQATVPSGIGVLGTPWRFDTPLLLAGLATMASVAYLLWLFRRGNVGALRLLAAAGFYVAFAAALVWVR